MEALALDLLSKVAQHLTVQEKVTLLIRLCSRCNHLHSKDFLYNTLQLPTPARPHCCYGNRPSSLPTIARLVPQLFFHYRSQVDNTRTDELVEYLRPVQLLLSSSFPHLQHLSLDIPYPCFDHPGLAQDEQLDLLFVWSPRSFPVLRSVRVTMSDGQNHSIRADPVSFASLALLPSLRSLVIEYVQFSVASLLFLVSLPLTQLDLEMCSLWYTTVSPEVLANPTPLIATHPPTTTLRVLRLPTTAHCSLVVETLLYHIIQRTTAVHADLEAGTDNRHTDNSVSPSVFPELEELTCRSELTLGAVRIIFSLSSLMHLDLLYAQTVEGHVVDLSPLWSSDRQPALSALQSFVFPRNSRQLWTRIDLREVLQASVALLSVYADQFRRVGLTIFTQDDLLPLLKAACACTQLQHLALVWLSMNTDPIDQIADNEDRDMCFFSLRSLRLHRIPLSTAGLSRLLACCPSLARCQLQAMPGLAEEVVSTDLNQHICSRPLHWQWSVCSTHVTPVYGTDRALQTLQYNCYCHRTGID